LMDVMLFDRRETLVTFNGFLNLAIFTSFIERVYLKLPSIK